MKNRYRPFNSFIVLLMLVVLLVLPACTPPLEEPVEQPAAVQETEFVEANPVTQTASSPTFDVTKTQIQSGEGLTQAILRSCSDNSGATCELSDFDGLGVVWDGAFPVYIESLGAFKSLGAVNGLGSTQPGQQVIWGTESEVREYAREYDYFSSATIQVNSNISVSGDTVIEAVTYYGGRFIQPLVITNSRSGPYEDFWRGFVAGVEYDSVNAAYAVATGQ